MPPSVRRSASPIVAQQIPDRARVELLARDLDRFVGLGVRPERHALLPTPGRHGRNVVLERLEIEQQRRRAQVLARARLADQVRIGTERRHRLTSPT